MIFASLGLDWSNFQRGMTGAMSAVRQLAGSAAVLAGATVAAQQFYKALDFGGQLADSTAQTGVAVDKLMELQFAFELAGMAANDVQPAIARLQRTIAEAATGNAQAVEKFSMMGVALKDIQGLSADEQLNRVGNAINKIENPTQRAAMAMEIFGKSGGKLLTFFSDMGMQGVQNALGKQSAVMLENAGVFARTADAMNIAGVKIRGFFVGLAENTAPQLITLVDKLEKLDLTGVGESLGNGIAIAVELLGRMMDKLKPFLDMSEKLGKTQSTYGGQAFMGMGGMGGPGTALSTATQAAGAEQPKTSFFDEILKDIEAKRAEIRKNLPTPPPGDTGAGFIPKVGTGGPLGMSDISSLQKVGGGSGMLSGMQTNSPAYQSVRIQEDIRNYIRDLVNVVKQNGQDYQIAPLSGGGMVLTA